MVCVYSVRMTCVCECMACMCGVYGVCMCVYGVCMVGLGLALGSGVRSVRVGVNVGCMAFVYGMA